MSGRVRAGEAMAKQT